MNRHYKIKWEVKIAEDDRISTFMRAKISSYNGEIGYWLETDYNTNGKLKEHSLIAKNGKVFHNSSNIDSILNCIRDNLRRHRKHYDGISYHSLDKIMEKIALDLL